MRAEGVRLAMIAPAPVDGKPLSHPDFDPVWAACSDEGVAPVFHVSGFESPLHPAWCRVSWKPARSCSTPSSCGWPRPWRWPI